MSVLALWLSKVLWGWSGLLLGVGIMAGIGLLVVGIVRFFPLGTRVRR